MDFRERITPCYCQGNRPHLTHDLAIIEFILHGHMTTFHVVNGLQKFASLHIAIELWASSPNDENLVTVSGYRYYGKLPRLGHWWTWILSKVKELVEAMPGRFNACRLLLWHVDTLEPPLQLQV